VSSKRPTPVGETSVDQWFVVETSVLRPIHGISGNEKADRLASVGTIRPAVDISVGFEISEAYQHVDVYIKHLWQQLWDCDPNCRHLYTIRS